MNQSHYPERLGLAVIVRAPPVFEFVWGIIRGLLDVRTREKVHVLADKYQELLLEHIDAAVLEEKYGGTRASEYPVPPEVEPAAEDGDEGDRTAALLGWLGAGGAGPNKPTSAGAAD